MSNSKEKKAKSNQNDSHAELAGSTEAEVIEAEAKNPAYPKAQTPIEEVSLEELAGTVVGASVDLAVEEAIDTAHTDGHTFNPHLAAEQGLTYTPPTDPPVIPSDNLEGVEIAAGFAPSMEESNPNAERLPSRIDGNDLDLVEDAVSALRHNSESSHLDNIEVHVENGVALLNGTVFSEEDIAIVNRIVANLDGIQDVVNHLTVAE